MKEQLPAPEFDANQYERPAQDWICGKAAEGQSCRIGPSPGGRCRATFECNPVLETKEGETKGRYRCTLPKELGGPCEPGPRPDGTCCRPITRCQPVRSVRAKRKVFTISVLGGTVGLLLLALYGPWRWQFLNPGELSSHHSEADFSRIHGGTNGLTSVCAACHEAAKDSSLNWVRTALLADPGPWHFEKLVSTEPANFSSIDRACQRCHQHRHFHQPNVVKDQSCSLCHREHLGRVPMRPTDSATCLPCHSDPRVMELSSETGKAMPADAFPLRVGAGLNLFNAARPESGYTHAFDSFAQGHPEFRSHTEKWRETNTLRFNHQRHFAVDIPLVDGKKLDCHSCHKPDPSGVFHQKINFAAHCQSCHALQFDARNPELTLPHGDPVYVRAFLNSLPRQYADFGARTKRITGQRELEAFVQEQMRHLREQVPSGEELERQVFFNADRTGPVADAGRLGNKGRARFAGCAYCHEVIPQREVAPRVTAPFIPDRWMLRSDFNHAKHTAVNCEKCHDVRKSRDTADVLLPVKRNCTHCHSPQGGAAHGCTACHQYHNQLAKEQVATK